MKNSISRRSFLTVSYTHLDVYKRQVEQGTHDQLIEAGGFYADLYNSQFEDVVD